MKIKQDYFYELIISNEMYNFYVFKIFEVFIMAIECE